MRRYTLTLETTKRYRKSHASPAMAEIAARKLFPDLEAGNWYQHAGPVKRDLFSRWSGEREWVGQIRAIH